MSWRTCLRSWSGRASDLAQPVPQAGIGAAGGGLDRAVANQLVDGHPEDLGQGGEVAGRGLLGVGLIVGDHPLRGADGLAELALAEAAGLADAAQPGPEGLGGPTRPAAGLERRPHGSPQRR